MIIGCKSAGKFELFSLSFENSEAYGNAAFVLPDLSIAFRSSGSSESATIAFGCNL